MEDAGCKQSVYWWATYGKVAFPPLVTGKESAAPEKRHGWDDCYDLLGVNNCCCWFDHVKGLKDFY